MFTKARPLVLLLTSLGLSACSGFGIVADVGYGQFELSGDVALAPSAGNINLQTIKTDVQDNLGLDEKMGTPYARAEVSAGIASFTFSGFQVDQSGRGNLTVNFGDIPINTPVVSDVDILSVKGAVHFDLIHLGPVRISPGVGVNLFDMQMSASSAIVPSLSESIDAVAPIPMLFVQGELDLGLFDAVLDVGGIRANVQDLDGSFIDVELVGRIRPTSNIEFFAGYRHIVLDLDGTFDNQNFLGDLTLSGWVIGGGIEF